MPMKNPERALLTTVGEEHALFLTVQILVKTHPNPSVLLLELNKIYEVGLAKLESHPIDDAVLAGYQDVVSVFRKILEGSAIGPSDIQP